MRARTDWGGAEEPLLGNVTSSASPGRGDAAPNPGWWSFLTFGWVSPLLLKGANSPQLHQADLPAAPPDADPAACGEALWAAWESQRRRAGASSPSLLWAVLRVFGRPYLLLGGVKLLNDALNFAGPVFLNGLLRYLRTAARPTPSFMAPGHPGSAIAGWSLPSSFHATLGWHADERSPAFGASCAALLALSLLAKALLNSHYSYRQGVVSARVRAALTCVVFRQALALDSAGLAAVGAGRVQTLMSVDADRVVGLFAGAHELWSLPLQIAVALWLLYTQVRFAFAAGLAVVLLLIPLNRALAGAIQAASVRMMAAKDDRVGVMVEALRVVRQIKAAAWEGAFAARAGAARGRELRALGVRKYLDALCVYLWACTSMLFTLATFGVCALTGQALTPEAVFTSLALFNVLLAPINAFPWVINGVVEAGVSVKRLGEYLQRPSGRQRSGEPSSDDTGSSSGGGDAVLPPKKQPLLGAAERAQGAEDDGGGSVDAGDLELQGDVAVRISQGSFTWHAAGSGGGPALTGIDLSVAKGAFVAITGDVGAGKTSLLCAVLGELERVQGKVWVAGPTAYVAQDPWAMQGSVRDNILLGASLDPGRYHDVLRVCALLPDLAAMPAGDATLVGDRGATLSGGQRARVALARALYRRDAEVLLLDDVLASVDAGVGAWLVQHALLGALTQGKTVLAVTHSPAVLLAADCVINMEAGRIAGIEWRPPADRTQLRNAKAAAELPPEASASGSGVALIEEIGGAAVTTAAPVDEERPVQQAQQEERETGHVRWGVYRRYLRLQGAWVPLTLVSLTLMQATRNASDLWLAHWVSESAPHGGAAAAQGPLQPLAAASGLLEVPQRALLTAAQAMDPQVRFYLTGLVILAAVNSVFTLARAFAFARGGMVAARRLHRRLLLSVLALPATFFDATPSGRILNRFSSDTATADDSLPFIANIFLAQAFGLAGVAVVLCFAQPWVALGVLLAVPLYRRLQRYYTASSRELRRLDAVAKSPVYSAFSSALDGGPTIRAFHAERHFMHSAQSAVAAQQRAGLASLAASCWLGLRLQTMAAAVAAGVAGLAVTQHSGALPGGAPSPTAAGLVGLSLAYVLPITGLLNGVLVTGAETEQEMVAVERIQQYLQLEPQPEVVEPSALSSRASTPPPPAGLAALLPGSADSSPLLPTASRAASARLSPRLARSGTVLPPDWPQGGHVTFRSVWLRYTPTGPFVLQRLNLDVPAGTSLGLCGRTGAGKSSALAALLRLVEVSAGGVEIDGVDVRRVPLRRLRRSVGFVPQSPFVFSATLRENLDPLKRSNDEELSAALRQAALLEQLTALADERAKRSPAAASDNDVAATTRATHSASSAAERSVLDLRLGQGGASLSLGQQQLLSVARVLLRRPKLVLLDECTASVDPGTAATMQRTVRTGLAGATVIEVAHRLSSIAGCDLVAVMEAGGVVEVGKPEELAVQRGSAFGEMLRQQQGAAAQEAAGEVAAAPGCRTS